MFKKEEKKKEIKESVAEPKAKPAAAAAAAAAADAIISAITDEIMIYDLEGNILRVNEAWEKGSGYKAKEVVGKPVFEALPMPPEFADKVPEILQQIVEKGYMKPTETVITDKSGRQRPVLFTASLIRDHEGNPMNVVAVYKDITELKRMQEKEKEAAAARMAADIIEAMGDGLILANMDGKIVSINPAFEKLTGYDKSELIEKEAAEFLPKWFKGEDMENMMNVFGTALEGKVPAPLIVSTITKSGEVVPATFTVSLIKDAEGKPTTIVAVIKDITELKRLQEKEKEAAAAKMAADVMEAMSDGLIVTDIDSNIVSFNKTMEAFMIKVGVDLKEFVGKSSLDLPIFRPEEIEKYLEFMKEAIEKGTAGPLETCITAGYWISITVSLLKDAEGNPTNLIAVARDITELKRAEEERIEAEKKAARSEEAEKYIKELQKSAAEKAAAATAAKARAEEAEKYSKKLKKAYDKLKTIDKMKSDFLSMAAHELRTPLTPVKTYVEMMMDKKYGWITSQQKEKLRLIDKSIDRLRILIDDMLNITKIEAGKLEAMRKPLSIGEIVDTALDEALSLFGERKHRITIDVPDGLPPVYADEKLIVKVFSNLLNNAMKYTHARGKITVTAKSEGKNIHITVADTGIGIPKKEQTKIFEKFYVGDIIHTPRYRGIGLGLAIAKGIVKAHNGKIWVESKGLGEGSTFHVQLPVMEKEK